MSPALRTCLAIAWLLAAAPAAATTLYKWQDDSGAVHFTQQPPPRGARLLSTIQADGSATPAREPAVVMFATATCPWCARARSYFRSRGVKWREIDIESSLDADREFKRRNGNGVPLIFVNDTRIDGFDAERLDQVLRRAGAVR